MRATAGLVGALAVAGCGRIGFGDRIGDNDAATMHDSAAMDVDSGSLPAWELVQVSGNSTSGGIVTLSTTLSAATVAGQLIVVGIQYEPGGIVSTVTDNATSGTSIYAGVAGSLAASAANVDNLEIWYAPTAQAGATTITVTTTSLTDAVVVWEFVTRQPATVDVVGELSNQAASVAPVSPTLTTANTGELVVAITIVADQVNTIATNNEFTNDTTTNGNGWAHITSEFAVAGGQQAEWASTSGTYCSDAVAFHVGE